MITPNYECMGIYIWKWNLKRLYSSLTLLNPTIAPNNLLKSNSSNPSASTQEFTILDHLPCSWTSIQQAPWPPSINRAHSSHLCKPSPPCPDLQCDGEPDLMALNVPWPFVQCVPSSHDRPQASPTGKSRGRWGKVREGGRWGKPKEREWGKSYQRQVLMQSGVKVSLWLISEPADDQATLLILFTFAASSKTGTLESAMPKNNKSHITRQHV